MADIDEKSPLRIINSVAPIRICDNGGWTDTWFAELGKTHHSSHVHERVIHHLEDAGPMAPQIEALRATAGPSRDALYAGDFAALGQAMTQNTEAQRGLHPVFQSIPIYLSRFGLRIWETENTSANNHSSKAPF